MKQSEAAQFWPLIKAWADGKELQWLVDGKWIALSKHTSYDFGMGSGSYRIKPAPRGWFLAVDPSGDVRGAYSTSEEANAFCLSRFGCTVVMTREVLE